MFATNYHFKELLEWFARSRFEYLLLFLPSCDTKDRKIDDFIIRNQASIDELTGSNIAYISYANMEIPNKIEHVKKLHIPPNAIRTHVYISDEVCDYYSFGKYKLPALILISRQLRKECKLFPITKETDLDVYFAPIGIITSFLHDYYRVEWNKDRYKSLEKDKKWKVEECSRLKEENHLLEDTIIEFKKDDNLAIRIDRNYCRLFNCLKAKKIKQNIFENVFKDNLDENDIVNKLNLLGLDKELDVYVSELISDLKKVKNFKKFQTQYGNVTQQIIRLISLCDQEMNNNTERIKLLTNEISDIERELLVAPEKLKKCNEELNEIIAIWGKKLNSTLLIDNGAEILLNSLNHYSSVLIDVLSIASEKLNGNNDQHIEETGDDRLIRNRKYDTFISYSRRDSEQVLSVVKRLQESGFTVWVDKDGIESGDAFKSVIVRAIKNSDVFLFFSSKDSNESPWTVKEVNTAVHLKKTIIPVRLDDTDYNDSVLFDLVGLDFVDLANNENRNSALEKLIESLICKKSPTKVDNTGKKNNVMIDLNYVDAEYFLANGELLESLYSLKDSFEGGNKRAATLICKVLFLYSGVNNWNKEIWRFFETQAALGQSFANIALFLKYSQDKETYAMAANYLKAALEDKNNNYVYICDGIAREKGIGIRPNIRSASHRYKYAFEKGITEAGSYFADVILKDKSCSQEDARIAMNILREGCEKGDARSYYILAKVYTPDFPIDGTYEKGMELFKKAISLHFHEAYIGLGLLYENFLNIEDRLAKAVDSYQEAINHGVKSGHEYLAKLYWKQGLYEEAQKEASIAGRENV